MKNGIQVFYIRDGYADELRTLSERAKRIGYNLQPIPTAPKKGHPVACVASDLNSKGEVAFAWATCSIDDNFDRKAGRAFAIGRLMEFRDKLPSVPKAPGVKTAIMRFIVTNKLWTNRRAKRAAQVWLNEHHPWQPLLRQPEVF